MRGPIQTSLRSVIGTRDPKKLLLLEGCCNSPRKNQQRFIVDLPALGRAVHFAQAAGLFSPATRGGLSATIFFLRTGETASARVGKPVQAPSLRRRISKFL
jgi:hypothetical protein